VRGGQHDQIDVVGRRAGQVRPGLWRDEHVEAVIAHVVTMVLVLRGVTADQQCTARMPRCPDRGFGWTFSAVFDTATRHCGLQSRRVEAGE